MQLATNNRLFGNKRKHHGFGCRCRQPRVHAVVSRHAVIYAPTGLPNAAERRSSSAVSSKQKSFPLLLIIELPHQSNSAGWAVQGSAGRSRDDLCSVEQGGREEETSISVRSASFSSPLLLGHHQSAAERSRRNKRSQCEESGGVATSIGYRWPPELVPKRVESIGRPATGRRQPTVMPRTLVH